MWNNSVQLLKDSLILGAPETGSFLVIFYYKDTVFKWNHLSYFEEKGWNLPKSKFSAADKLAFLCWAPANHPEILVYQEAGFPANFSST